MSFPAYSTYSESGVKWLGKIPAHWSVVPFKKLLDIRNGADHKHIVQEQGYPVIGSGGAFAFASDFLYDGESVLLGRKGTIDKPLYINEKFWTVDTMYWSVIEPGVFGKFAYYVALTIPFDYYSTNTALPSMTKSVLGAHPVARPTYDEQIALADFLDHETSKIDVLISEQERLIELLLEKRLALISSSVICGIDNGVNMVSLCGSHGVNVPSDWRQTVIKRFATLQRGHDLTNDEREEGDIPVVTSSGVNGFHNKFMAKGPGVVTGRYGSTGKVFYIERDFWPHNTSLYVNDFHGNLPRFAWYFFQTVDFAAHSEKSAVPGIDRNDIHVLPVAIPPINTQHDIVDYLDAELEKIDLLLIETDRAISLLIERRTATISAAVTGKIDVRGLA
jgi:type I restriction enzyme S subunit